MATKSAKDEMILFNTGLAKYLVGEYLKECTLLPKPHPNDLEAIALYGLTLACSRISPWNTKPGGYLAKAIMNELRAQAYLESRGGMSFKPKRRKRDGKVLAVPKNPPYVFQAERWDYDGEDREGWPDKDKGVRPRPKVNTDLAAVDLRDCLNRACRDDVDRKVLELHEQRFTGDEIAERVGRPPSYVYYRLDVIRRAARELLDDENSQNNSR